MRASVYICKWALVKDQPQRTQKRGKKRKIHECVNVRKVARDKEKMDKVKEKEKGKWGRTARIKKTERVGVSG